MADYFGKEAMIAVHQGVKTLSEPMKRCGNDLESKRIIYNNHPIDKWNLANTAYDEDKNGNIQPHKTSKSTRRIDGTAAMLDAYTIYVIPVINPDGYEQSFVINTRPNLRPQDANGNNIPFSDPYADLDGDGFIATLYRGKADDTPSRELPIFGMESPDWDENGVLGDDPRNSGIDMNRTFDYQWNRYDIETKDTQQVGNVNWTSAGTAPATEPEIRALQQFLYTHELGALVSLHTGIQCVLYPWCYRAYDAENPDDAEIPFMKDTASKMAQAFQDYTGRGFYSMSSNEDRRADRLCVWALQHPRLHDRGVQPRQV